MKTSCVRYDAIRIRDLVWQAFYWIESFRFKIYSVRCIFVNVPTATSNLFYEHVQFSQSNTIIVLLLQASKNLFFLSTYKNVHFLHVRRFFKSSIYWREHNDRIIQRDYCCNFYAIICEFSPSTRYQRNVQQPKHQWNLWHSDQIRLIKGKHIKLTTSYFLIFNNEFPGFSVRRQNCVGKSLFRVDIKRNLLPHLKGCILFIMLDPVLTGNDFRFPHKTGSLEEMG